MKKTIAKTRSQTSANARRSTASASRVGKKTANKAALKTKGKKTTSPKGLKHHAKRLYHVTPKFIHGMIAGASVGVMVVGILSASAAFNPSPTSAANKCDAHGIGNRTMTNSTNNTAYSISGNKTTVTFNVVGQNCHLPVTMVVWKAPNGTTGKPYSAQTLFMHVSKTFGEGRHQMTATLPDCYFQVDTVTGTKLTGSTGQAYNYDTRQVAFMHGGNKSCKKPNVPPPTILQVCDLQSFEIVPIDEADFDATLFSKDLTKCQTPPRVTAVEAASVQTLPNTGAGAVIVIGVLAVAGGVISHKLHHHTRNKRNVR